MHRSISELIVAFDKLGRQLAEQHIHPHLKRLSLRCDWNRKILAGTGTDLLLSSRLQALPLDKWSTSLMMPASTFVIESPVVRHYGLATIFISEESNLLQSLSVLSAPRERQLNIFDTIRPHRAKWKKPSLQSQTK